MRNNYRDQDDHSRSRSREKEDRDYSHRYQPRDNRNIVKLHVGNLPLNTPEEVVQSQFQRFGRVEDVKIMRKNANGQPLREFLYGFIVMNNEEDAKRALELINRNTELGWQVSYSKEKPRGGGDDHRRSPDRYHHHQHQNQHQHHGQGQGQGQHYQPHHYHHRDPRDQRDMREHRDYRDHRDQRDPRDQRDYRYKRDDDDYHNRYRRDRSPRRNDYGDNRRRDRSGSLENRNQGQAAPNQGSALMNILQKNMGANNQDTTADLLTILNLPPEKLAELTTSMEKNILNGNSILVRELWLGNLPDNLPEKKLQNAVEMLGDVENIEYFTKPNGSFAFVKFKKVSQASKANEGIQSLRMLLDSPNLKTAFSDHQRRKGVVGDNIDYEKDEELTSIIYIGFNQKAKMVSTNEVRDMFSKYGEVINISATQSRDFNSKAYMLVEMGTLEQAKTARERIYLRDDTREKRYRLGDRDCELIILIKAPKKEPGHGYQKQPQQHPGMNPNAQMYQQQGYQGQQGYQQRQQPPYQQYPQNQSNPQYNQYNQQQQQQQYGYNKPPYGGDNKNFRQQQQQQQQQNYYNNPNAQGQGGQTNYGGQRDFNQMNVQPPTVPNPNQRQGFPPQNIPGQQGSFMQGQGAQQANRYSPSGAMPPNQLMPTSPGGQNFSPGMGQARQFPGGAGGPNPNYFPPGSSNPPYNVQNVAQGQVQGQTYPGAGNPTGSVEKRPDEQQKGSSFGLLDTLQGLLAQKNQAPKEVERQEEPIKTAPAAVIEEEAPEGETIWSGFITKNKQNRVGVDANLITGDELILKDYFNLNISHRTLYDEVSKREPRTIVVFVPTNGTQASLFEEYKKYFEEKSRAGVVTLKKNVLYLMPPCEEAFKIHKFGQNEILGVFTDNGEVIKESIS